jgi:flagellar motor switch protein FliG
MDKTLILTMFGEENEVKQISISTFKSELDSRNYCDSINELELKNGWISAIPIEENKKISLLKPIMSDFSVITNLTDRDIQKVMREVDSIDLAKALKSANKEVQTKIFSNMSKRAAQMLQEDMEYMGPIPKDTIKDSQKLILRVVNHLIQRNEISNIGEILI